MRGKVVSSKTMMRSQAALIGISIAAVVVGAVSQSRWGDQFIVYGACGIVGGLILGLFPILLTPKQKSGRMFGLWYPLLGVVGIMLFVTFLIGRMGSDSPDIGLGFLALLGAVVGLPGIAGTIAITQFGEQQGIRQP